MTTTLTQQCYEQLQKDILEGRYLPGEKLRIQSLAKEYHVGPTPIREALSRLTKTGLVEAIDNKGFRVVKITYAAFQDLYDTFYLIENLAMEQAIEKGDDAWEAGIVAALYQLAQVETEEKLSLKNYAKWSGRNALFHRAIVQGCQSNSLMQIRDNLSHQFDHYIVLAFMKDTEELSIEHAEHKALADAVIRRDKAQASLLLREHIQGGKETIFKKIKKYLGNDK